MRLIAKAALGALAIASVATTVSTPASAQRMTVTVGTPNAVIVERRDPCFRAPEFRPASCFRREGGDWNRFAFNDRGDWRDRYAREHMWRERERDAERQAFLDHRYHDYYDMNR